jgi:hypothetical protein
MSNRSSLFLLGECVVLVTLGFDLSVAQNALAQVA